MAPGAARERAGSFSSSATTASNTGELEEFQLMAPHQLPAFDSKPFLAGSPPEMGDGDVDGDLQRITGASDPPPAPPAAKKKKRSLPGTPDPSAEVIALSPKTLMATNRFVCEICHKGFQRDQNLQLHRRGHNLPWKLRQRGADGGGAAPPRKRVYVCPEPSCVHHSATRALGDLTGIKKHFCRKHGEKKWKCDRCAKKYAVHSDWKAHYKVCGTREYKCDCGTVFSRRDSFVTHRAFCDALAQENNKLAGQTSMNMATVASALQGQAHHLALQSHADIDDASASAAAFCPDIKIFSDDVAAANKPLPPLAMAGRMLSGLGARDTPSAPLFHGPGDAAAACFSPGTASASTSATALLQKAAEMGATTTSSYAVGFGPMMSGLDRLLPAVSPFVTMRDHGAHDGLLMGQTQLVGFGTGGPLPGLHNGGAAHSIGAMTRAIGSLMNGGGHHGEHRRGGMVDYMGVDDQRSFDGVTPFGPQMDPWA